MKIVIWGLGQIFEENRSRINDKDIICLVDSSAKKRGSYGKNNVILPEELVNYEYDYIVIFSSKYYDEISYQLVINMGVDCRKVIIWSYFLGCQFYDFISIGNIINQYCRQEKIREILDVGGVFSKNQILGLKEFCNIDLLYNGEDDIYIGGYRNINKRYEKNTRFYDLLLLDYEYYKMNYVHYIQQLMLVSVNFLFIIPFEEIRDVNLNQNEFWGIVNYGGYLFGYNKNKNKHIRIFEATHKEFIPIKDLTYVPIHAGALYGTSLDYQGDDCGDNISRWNAKINECTVLYWVWKNIKTDIVGMSHYRRFLKSQINSYMLQEREIELLMDQYDILVAEHINISDITIEKHLKSTVCEEAFTAAILCLYEIFDSMNENEKSAIRYTFQGHIMYPYNIFITSKKIMDEYCSWLFPIIFKLIDKVVIHDEWDSYSKRIIGFIAERLFTVWLVQQNYRIKELEVLKTGDVK